MGLQTPTWTVGTRRMGQGGRVSRALARRPVGCLDENTVATSFIMQWLLFFTLLLF